MATLTPEVLTSAYMTRSTAVRERVLAYVEALWNGSASLRDSDIERLISRIAPAVHGGQLQVANITAAYISQLAALERVGAAPVRVERDEILGYRGVPDEEVYRRPAVAVYAALSAGVPFSQARDVGLNRLKSIAATDMQQARNRQAQAGYAAGGFEYTVRVLSGNENCALCVVAATQRYRVGGLQAIHPGCDCGERGVRGSYDPGVVLDREMVEETHSAIWEQLGRFDRSAKDLGAEKVASNGRRVSDFTDLIITRQHGELGPTLAWREDKFTGPSGLN